MEPNKSIDDIMKAPDVAEVKKEIMKEKKVKIHKVPAYKQGDTDGQKGD
ncbi:MAG: hypothetical protein QXW39_06240 [Candidatus Bathyarchaeia archaeon]